MVAGLVVVRESRGGWSGLAGLGGTRCFQLVLLGLLLLAAAVLGPLSLESRKPFEQLQIGLLKGPATVGEVVYFLLKLRTAAGEIVVVGGDELEPGALDLDVPQAALIENRVDVVEREGPLEHDLRWLLCVLLVDAVEEWVVKEGVMRVEGGADLSGSRSHCRRLAFSKISASGVIRSLWLVN